jgi:hypothetical protein
MGLGFEAFDRSRPRRRDVASRPAVVAADYAWWHVETGEAARAKVFGQAPVDA